MFPAWEEDEMLPVTDVSVRSEETSLEPLFTEASLLSEMENRGLGTPSTRAGAHRTAHRTPVCREAGMRSAADPQRAGGV